MEVVRKESTAAVVDEASCSQSSPIKGFSFSEAIWDSILKPGATPFLRMAMNVVFFALLIILIFLMIATSFNIHVVMFFLLSALLFVSIHWYLGEMMALESREGHEHDKKEN